MAWRNGGCPGADFHFLDEVGSPQAQRLPFQESHAPQTGGASFQRAVRPTAHDVVMSFDTHGSPHQNSERDPSPEDTWIAAGLDGSRLRFEGAEHRLNP